MSAIRTLTALLILALSVGAQGKICGRLLSSFGMGPVAEADLEIRTEGPTGFTARVRGKSDPDGRFELPVERLHDGGWLIVRARGLAPRVVPLRATPGGEGLILEDLLLDRGAAFEITLDDEGQPEGFSPKGVRVSFHPLLGEGDLVDLDLLPLVGARVDATGKVRLEQVPPGPGLLVIEDGFASAAPLSIFWRMGHEKAVLRDLRLLPGADLGGTFTGPQSRGTRARLTVSSGAWRPEGGREIRLAWRTGLRASGSGRFFLEAKHLPEGAVDLTVEGRGEGLRLRGIAGYDFPEQTLVAHAQSRLRVQGRPGGRSLSDAWVEIEGKRYRCDARGEVTVPHPPEGAFGLVMAPGALSRRLRFDPADPNRRRPRRLVELEMLTSVSGNATDIEDQPIPRAWIVASPRSRAEAQRTAPRFGPREGLGLPIVARADDAGKFRTAPVLGHGLTRVRGFLPGTIAVAPSFRETTDIPVTRTTGLRPAARVKGRILMPGGAPAEGIDVVLADADLPWVELRRAPPLPRLETPSLHHTLTSEKGAFRFQGVTPGTYRVIVRAPGAKTFIGPPVRLLSGVRVAPLEYRLREADASALRLPPQGAFRIYAEDDAFPEFFFSPPPVADDEQRASLDLSEEEGAVVRVEPLRIMPESEFDRREVPEEDHGGWPGSGREGERRVLLPLEEALAERPTYARHAVDIVVSFGSEAPDRRPFSLTLFPVGAPRGYAPRRVIPDPRSGFVAAALPRGLWVAHAEAPGFGEVVTPPFALGIDGPSMRDREWRIAIPAWQRVAGSISAGDDEELWGGRPLRLVSANDRHLEPFARHRRLRVPRLEGSFDFPDVPTGLTEIAERRGHRHLRVSWIAAAYDFVETGELTPQLFSRPVAESAPELTAERAPLVWPRGRGPAESPGRRGPLASTDPYEIRAVGTPASAGQPSPTEMSFLFPGPGRGGVDPGVEGPRDESERLEVGRQLLRNWPVQLIPADDEAYAFGLPILGLRSGEGGRLRLPSRRDRGAFLSLLWEDRRGVLYRGLFDLGGVPEQRRRRRFGSQTGRLVVDVKRAGSDRARIRARVRVVPSRWRGLISGSVLRRQHATVATALTDSRGRAVFDQLPFGSYDLKVHAPDRGVALARNIELRTTARDARAEVTLSAPSTIRVRVRDEAGRPVPGGRVFLFDPDNTEMRDEVDFWCDGDGNVEVGDLPAGTYAVLAQGFVHPPRFIEEVSVGPGGRLLIDATLERGGDLDVVVLNPAGRPVPGARVLAQGENPALRLFGPGARRAEELPVWTDDEGVLGYRDFPAGTYRIEVSHEAYATQIVEGTLAVGEFRRVEVRFEKKSGKNRTPPDEER